MNLILKNALEVIDQKIAKRKENIHGIRLELMKGRNVFHPNELTEYRKHIYAMEEEVFDLEKKREMLIKTLKGDTR